MGLPPTGLATQMQMKKSRILTSWANRIRLLCVLLCRCVPKQTLWVCVRVVMWGLKKVGLGWVSLSTFTPSFWIGLDEGNIYFSLVGVFKSRAVTGRFESTLLVFLKLLKVFPESWEQDSILHYNVNVPLDKFDCMCVCLVQVWHHAGRLQPHDPGPAGDSVHLGSDRSGSSPGVCLLQPTGTVCKPRRKHLTRGFKGIVGILAYPLFWQELVEKIPLPHLYGKYVV